MKAYKLRYDGRAGSTSKPCAQIAQYKKVNTGGKMKQEKFLFVTCPVCGCETLVDLWRVDHRCDICHQIFTMIFKWGVK